MKNCLVGNRRNNMKYLILALGIVFLVSCQQTSTGLDIKRLQSCLKENKTNYISNDSGGWYIYCDGYPTTEKMYQSEIVYKLSNTSIDDYYKLICKQWIDEINAKKGK